MWRTGPPPCGPAWTEVEYRKQRPLTTSIRWHRAPYRSRRAPSPPSAGAHGGCLRPWPLLHVLARIKRFRSPSRARPPRHVRRHHHPMGRCGDEARVEGRLERCVKPTRHAGFARSTRTAAIRINAPAWWIPVDDHAEDLACRRRHLRAHCGKTHGTTTQ
jgi:hypothetical protein